MTANAFYVSADRWTCPHPDCGRTLHQGPRTADTWATVRLDAQLRHAAIHAGRKADR